MVLVIAKMKVEGTCAIITGGANGIGEAVVRLLVSKG
jgi:NAD(P)-dependent dehydrogenase (short-subunit alcohol dehydrogenase family)